MFESIDSSVLFLLTIIPVTIMTVAVWLVIKTKGNKLVFGRKCRIQAYMLKDTVTFCNHGSYSAAPRKVIETQRRFQLEQESNPEAWFRYEVSKRYSEAIDRVAKYFASDPENLVLVENATTAINMVTKSLKWSPGDKILITNHIFDGVKNIVLYIQQINPGIEIVTMEISWPIECKEQILQQLAETIDFNPGIKLAILDHITSASALLMPIEEMLASCHDRGVMVMVDGAHAPGQVKLELDQLGADFYTGNLHKWCYATRGCAILYVHPNHTDIIHPLVTSHLQFLHRLRDRFSDQGTKDYTSLCAATAAIEFFEEIGGMDAVSKYNSNLVDWAAVMLSNAWKTSLLPVPRSLRAPYMALVRLPHIADVPTTKGCDDIASQIYQQYKLHTRCTFVDGKYWIRVSAHIYNDEGDYFTLRNAVEDMFKLDRS